MKRLFISAIIIASIASCKNSYSPIDSYINATNERFLDSIKCREDAQKFIDSITVNTWPIKVLENSTRSYVTLNVLEAKTLRPLDTIWVNLATHKMDDTCNTAMKCVVFYKPLNK